MFKRFPFIHNHGDFVHLDALRDWLRGVVSLESFLQTKDEKAIVKDMHFTDERTTVDYIDTKDDTAKTETLCEYLTSDVFDETNPSLQNKVDKINVRKDKFNENWLDMREKTTQKQRLGVIRSNVPIAYDATDNYSTSQNRTAHLGFTNHSIKLYSDDDLNMIKRYDFCNPIAYNVTDNYKNSQKAYYLGVNNDGITIFNNDTQEVLQKYAYGEVKRYAPADYRHFTNIMDVTSPGNATNIDFIQSYIVFFAIKNKVISAQAKLKFTNSVTIASGGYKILRMVVTHNAADVITSDFINSELVFPKIVRCSNNAQDSGKYVISSINQGMQNNNSPITNGDFYISLYNPTNYTVTIDDFVIAY